jgi:hypothetical protein
VLLPPFLGSSVVSTPLISTELLAERLIRSIKALGRSAGDSSGPPTALQDRVCGCCSARPILCLIMDV